MASFIKSDLEFILQQIIFAERHAAGANLRDLFPNTEVPWGLRTISGALNSLEPGQSQFGAADNVFPRLTTPLFRPAEAAPRALGRPRRPPISRPAASSSTPSPAPSAT